MTDTRYYLKRVWPFWVILLTGILALVSLTMSGKISNEMFLGGVATLLTLYISVVNYFQSSDRFFKDLFTEFNHRYNELNEFLNGIQADKILSEVEKQKVVDYLNLCAEEYMWVRRGRIPVHIWNSWKNGIQRHLTKIQLKEIFEHERSLWKSSYYGFFEELDI